MDALLSRVKPINNNSSASVVMQFRSGKKILTPAARKEKREQQPCQHPGQSRRRKKGAHHVQVEISLQPILKSKVRQAVFLQLMKVHGREDVHLQPMEDLMLEQMCVPKGDCDLVGSPGWSRLMAESVDL
ncbi:hypothetical protein WISP_62315 [Willisornis vidua]|uniref:Uncharacterized protein n=1 Tax=Willisornis vidua TaxID=1566151 RepID=A0ABQ9DD28_9PASS|nr:hypothetical protein WISP_62315 [Willisornis vidua]